MHESSASSPETRRRFLQKLAAAALVLTVTGSRASVPAAAPVPAAAGAATDEGAADDAGDSLADPGWGG